MHCGSTKHPIEKYIPFAVSIRITGRSGKHRSVMYRNDVPGMDQRRPTTRGEENAAKRIKWQFYLFPCVPS
jgi:hypothetical protein